MKKSHLFVLSITLLGLNAVACGGGSNPPSECTPPSGVDGVAYDQYCTTVTNTSTETSTGSITGTGGVGGTGGTTVIGGTGGTTTDTSTSTAVSTFVYTDEACDYAVAPKVRPIVYTGLWTGKDKKGVSWNICITNASETDIRIGGYGFKTSELGQANPPSLVAYKGVMGYQCIQVYPVSAASDGPEMLANDVLGDKTTGFTITDGVSTFVRVGDASPCTHKIPGT